MPFFRIIYLVFWSLFVGHAKFSLEMLALYQQLAVLQRSIPRPRLRNRDRLFWIEHKKNRAIFVVSLSAEHAAVVHIQP